MSFPRYPAYKDSGVEWLSQVPAHWEVEPCRAVFTERSDRNDPLVSEDYLSLMANVGVIPYAEKGDVGNKKPEDLTKCKLVFAGDLVINSMNYGIGSYGLSSLTGVCSPVYIVLKPKLERIEERFAFRILENKAFQGFAQSHGNGILEHRAAINWDILKGIGVPLPPVAEQQAILGFLDRETAKIDALVAEQEQLITLLKEKRQAVISHAVTKGLDPSVPMKDSGVEWLGEVPEHWQVCTLRRLIKRIEQGWSPECEAQPADENSWGVLKAGCVNRGIFNPEENKTLPDSLDPLPEYEVQEGDILMSRASGSPELVGSTALVYQTRPRLMLSDKIFRIHPEAGQDRSFFVWSMNAKHMREQIEQALSGGNGLANNLPQSVLLSFVCAVPPEAEQQAISCALDQESAQIDQLTAEAVLSIELLRERRSALISAAVTGQIDVRQFAQ